MKPVSDAKFKRFLAQLDKITAKPGEEVTEGKAMKDAYPEMSKEQLGAAISALTERVADAEKKVAEHKSRICKNCVHWELRNNPPQMLKYKNLFPNAKPTYRECSLRVVDYTPAADFGCVRCKLKQ